MSVLEQALLDWQKDQTKQFFALLETRLEETQTQQDIVQKFDWTQVWFYTAFRR